MNNVELLRAMGWTEELIQAARQVAEAVAAAAVVGSVSLELTTGAATTEVAQHVDVSGPPVAQPQLCVIR
jgi:hypothetical protein